MEGAVRAPTSSTTNTADGSTTASATSVISAARTRTAEPGGMGRTENMDMETDTSLLQTPTPWTRISEPGEDLTHSSCPQESVTARTSSSAPLVSSLLPSANPSSHPSSTRPLSYAQITNRTTSPPSSSSAPLSPSPLKMTETRRQQRTQILRRTAYGTTTKDILQTVTAQMGVPEEQLFECVIRDPDDHRRFYVTYRTQQMKTRTTGKGYYIGDLHIRPTDDYLTGYIPHPPYYTDRQTLDDLLSSFGTVKETSFVTTDRNTRIGGYKFKLKLKNDVGRPTSLLYNGFTMVIRYQDDVKQCAFCKRYGHIISACRTKKAADADRQRARESQQEEDRANWKREHHLLQTATDDAVLMVQSNYATAKRQLEIVYDQVRIDLCTQKTSDANMLIWDAVCERESDTVHSGFTMEIAALYETCNDQQSALSQAYTKRGITVDLPPPAPTDIDALLATIPAPEPSSTDQSDIDALSSELLYIYSIKVPTLDATEISSQVQPSSSHHHHVTTNSDADRIAKEQRERTRLNAEKDRLAAKSREEHRVKEQQRIQAKHVQKEKARQAAILRKQKVELALAAQKETEDRQRQEMEIVVDRETSSDEPNSSGSDSEKELLTTIDPPTKVVRRIFSQLPETDRVVIRKKYTDRLPSGYARHHCPTTIHFRTKTPNFHTLVQNSLFDAVLISELLPCNPMELLTEHHDDIYDIAVMTKDTLEFLLSFLKSHACGAHLLDGPHVKKNKHYAPATADK